MTNPLTHPTRTAHTGKIVSWRDRTALILMLLAFVGAFISFLAGIGASVTADPAIKVVEIWRSYGFVLCSGLFLLLAFFPRRYPGIWELAILNKAALAITGLIWLGYGIQDAATIAFSDGTLALILALSYILTRGYSGWKTLKTPATTEKREREQFSASNIRP